MRILGENNNDKCISCKELFKWYKRVKKEINDDMYSVTIMCECVRCRNLVKVFRKKMI